MKVRNKKLVYTIIGIVAVLLVAITITYAYWLITKNQTGENVITAACLDISLTEEENDITLTNQFPLSDADGMKLTPYTFTVTNNCNTSVDYQIALETFEGADTISSSAIKVMIDSDTPVLLNSTEQLETRIANATNSYLLKYGTLSAKDTEGSSANHNLRLWIDENAPISEMKKTLTSKISVTIGQGIEAIQGSTLASLILNHAENNNYLYSTTPDFSKVTEDGEYGLYSAQDDYGTSYYFRGDVENNYVKFGKWASELYWADGPTPTYYNSLEECETGENHTTYGTECVQYVAKNDSMYWRIVRINGDGTIRLVYDGTSAVANSESHRAIIDKAVYNTKGDDVKYVGYTYDDGTGTQVDSTIKGVVETWYENNLESDYGKYVADSIFCNDRQVTSTSGITATYGAYTRLITNKSPKLSCTQDADKYTVSSARGNGLLTKPVGLMTADEMAMAGGSFAASNSDFYLYTGLSYDWSMSPYYFNGGIAYVWGVNYDGFLNYDYVCNNYLVGARPVINLKADNLFSGNGTATNPYVLAS